MTYFERIPHAGTNVLTEILHARDPARFPVMNRNSVAGMGLAHIKNYPPRAGQKKRRSGHVTPGLSQTPRASGKSLA